MGLRSYDKVWVAHENKSDQMSNQACASPLYISSNRGTIALRVDADTTVWLRGNASLFFTWGGGGAEGAGSVICSVWQRHVVLMRMGALSTLAPCTIPVWS